MEDFRMTLDRVDNLKNKLVDVRSDLLEIMETYDIYQWHNETKYLNADLTAVMAFVQATINEINEIRANHIELLEESDDF
jgi:hypothetical protein